ncbi:hypothetical protein B0H16DRAFT_1483430 [Mycena metata]|uniref:Uncharacterized protein n=1 Tax=Mycena metata TaxID=1033252 RepID=A0AAD7DY53_9AGAR|nr:hypothetical protein B0H16DRAFT_1483430 [Mycena metata]
MEPTVGKARRYNSRDAWEHRGMYNSCMLHLDRETSDETAVDFKFPERWKGEEVEEFPGSEVDTERDRTYGWDTSTSTQPTKTLQWTRSSAWCTGQDATATVRSRGAAWSASLSESVPLTTGFTESIICIGVVAGVHIIDFEVHERSGRSDNWRGLGVDRKWTKISETISLGRVRMGILAFTTAIRARSAASEFLCLNSAPAGGVILSGGSKKADRWRCRLSRSESACSASEFGTVNIIATRRANRCKKKLTSHYHATTFTSGLETFALSLNQFSVQDSTPGISGITSTSVLRSVPFRQTRVSLAGVSRVCIPLAASCQS